MTLLIVNIVQCLWKTGDGSGALVEWYEQVEEGSTRTKTSCHCLHQVGGVFIKPDLRAAVWCGFTSLNELLLTLQICTSQVMQAATLPRAWHFKLRINSPNFCYWRITRKIFFFILCFNISMYTSVTLDIVRAMRSKRVRWVGHAAHRPYVRVDKLI